MTWQFEYDLNFHQGMPWEEFINQGNIEKANEEAIDLLARMLTWDYHDRITSLEALEHPYFNSVRGIFEPEKKQE